MASEPLVRFYDLSGPKPWSPACWRTRYALNFKRIPFECVKLSYPAVKPKCRELLSPTIEDRDATVPIIEILQGPYVVLNDSTPIAKLLNERFTEKDGYSEIKLVKEVEKYEEEIMFRQRAIFRWISCDVWKNALDDKDGSKEYYRTTREINLGPLETITERRGGGDAAVYEDHKVQWLGLKERMAKEDGTGERESSHLKLDWDLWDWQIIASYIDFYDASLFRWVEAANAEKGLRLMNLYEDDTFTKLMNKVKRYEGGPGGL
jgi:hypothetical protein